MQSPVRLHLVAIESMSDIQFKPACRAQELKKTIAIDFGSHFISLVGSCACSEPNAVEKCQNLPKNLLFKRSKKKKTNADICEHSDMLNHDWLKFISCLIVWIS
jgi:hypothetical protein